MAFPGPGAQVYYNEEGEPLGWDYPSQQPEIDYYCNDCGFAHFGECEPYYDEEDDGEDQ